MDELVAWLWDVTYWHWWALAVLLIGVEVFAASTFLLWPAFAAVVVGIVVAFAPDLDWRLQLIGFAGLSVVATIGGRALWQRYRGETTEPNLNRRGQQYVGRRLTLTDDFADGSGCVHLDDTWWPARTIDGRPIASGRLVEIVSVQGIEVQVKEC